MFFFFVWKKIVRHNLSTQIIINRRFHQEIKQLSADVQLHPRPTSQYYTVRPGMSITWLLTECMQMAMNTAFEKKNA